MPIKKINEFPDGSGTLTSDDIFLMMDNPSSTGQTKKLSLSVLTSFFDAGISDSDRYIIVKSGDDILTKYAAAKLLTPGGAALSATNRAYLIIMPGNYTVSTTWNIDGEYVDIIGLGSSALGRGCIVSVKITSAYNANVTASNFIIKGISLFGPGFRNNSTYLANLNGTFINCSNGNFGFGLGNTMTGTFINCSGGDNSFGGSFGQANGTFINCSGGNFSFGGLVAAGTFINCSGGDNSFGIYDTATGTFTDCYGGDNSFGMWGITGTCINCSGGSNSFGAEPAEVGGILLKCILRSGTFSAPTANGRIRLCIDGNYNIINSGGLI